MNRDRFCLIPFTSIVYRPDGKIITCSQGKAPIGPRHRLDEWPADKIWNSVFMKQFRMAKMNNEYVENCYSCYYDDDNGYTSKRQWYLDKYAPEDLEAFIEDVQSKNGVVDTVPWHWEIRLSNTCNAQCVMCGPQNSSKIASELYNNIDNPLLPDEYKMRYSNYLKDTKDHTSTDAIIASLIDNLEHVKLIELHGGEPWAEPKVVQLLNDISETKYAKNILIKTFSNCTLLTEEKVNVLNKFKGGEFICSIDAYGKESEYVRYPLTWEDTERGLKLLTNILKPEWKLKSLSVTHAFNVWNIDKLFTHLLQYERLQITQSPVSRPQFLIIDILPKVMRELIFQKLEVFDGIEKMDHIKRSMQTHLRKPTTKSKDILLPQFISYYKYLDSVRKQNTLETFPHLKCLVV